MTRRNSRRLWARLAGFALPGLAGLAAIGFLALTVSRDIARLNTASSDNIQWTLSQTEVEFLQFDLELAQAMLAAAPDTGVLRRKFDIFFSRVHTLRRAPIYSDLRALPEFAANLAAVVAYLDRVVPAIDSETGDLVAALPQLRVRTAEVRPDVRRLSVSGLNYFAEESDSRRHALSATLRKLALAVAVLVAALAVLACYLAVLNRQNVRRRTQVLEASERMNIVTGTSLDAVIVADSWGLIMDFNAAAEQIFGYSAAEALGRDLGDLIVPEHHRAAHRAGMARLRRTGEKRVAGSGRFRLEASRKNGEVFPVELAIQPADTRDGEIFIAFLRDISSQQRAEAELVLARDSAMAGEKAKTDFLATMSHEIRTPLNGLLGNLSLLEETPLSAQQRRYIRNMETSGRLLRRHISDVLDITKFDAGKLRLHPAGINVSALLQDIVDSQSGAAAANGSMLAWGWNGAPLGWIHADPGRIQHILMNIVGNAVKFTRNGRISITAQASGAGSGQQTLRISVRDSGIGIEADLLPRIFDDFTTGDSSYDREVGGTGLGLGIAQRFVKALGGSITVDSTPGKGSVFHVSLPVQVIAEPPPPALPPAEPAMQKVQAQVLVVEDNAINRLVAREMLTAQGHCVIEAHNGREAVARAQEAAFDIILMDISMPVMDGRSAARAIRTGGGRSARAPIIAVTANAMAAEQEAYLADGMNGVLTKPLTREGLSALVARHAGKGGPPPAAARSQHLIELEEMVGPGALAQLLNRFTAEMDSLLDRLELPPGERAANAAADAHRFAGSAASFGLPELRNALLALEAAALNEDERALQAELEQLRDVWASASARLGPA